MMDLIIALIIAFSLPAAAILTAILITHFVDKSIEKKYANLPKIEFPERYKDAEVKTIERRNF